MTHWHIYNGTGVPHEGITRLPPAPPWRTFDGGPLVTGSAAGVDDVHQAISYRPDPAAVEQVNAALYLRRPLMVTGRPGTGKSTLAQAVSHELGLGPVLHWPITSRVTLHDGLYQYDPLTRLYAASRQDGPFADDDIGRYIRLGPLGTALLPSAKPRVLLIDEIDKSDIDLPNDLLTIFEKGSYEIPELARIARREARVMTTDEGGWADIQQGRVHCHAFPLVIMTSNGEREFPPAFLRRCVTLELKEPTPDKLKEIIRAHLDGLADESDDLIGLFLSRKKDGQLATDQLLHAVYLAHHAAQRGVIDRTALAERIMPFLSGDTLSDGG